MKYRQKEYIINLVEVAVVGKYVENRKIPFKSLLIYYFHFVDN